MALQVVGRALIARCFAARSGWRPFLFFQCDLGLDEGFGASPSDVVPVSCRVSCRIVSYRVVLCRIVSRIVSCRIVSYRVAYRIVSCRLVSYRVVTYLVVSYRIISHILSTHSPPVSLEDGPEDGRQGPYCEVLCCWVWLATFSFFLPRFGLGCGIGCVFLRCGVCS